MEAQLKEAATSSKQEVADLNHQLEQEKREKCDLEGQLKDTAVDKSMLEKQLKDAAAKLKNDLAMVNRQLDTERAEKQELEVQLAQRLQSVGEEAIEEAVNSALASREIRYNKLREEYEVRIDTV